MKIKLVSGIVMGLLSFQAFAVPQVHCTVEFEVSSYKKNIFGKSKLVSKQKGRACSETLLLFEDKVTYSCGASGFGNRDFSYTFKIERLGSDAHTVQVTSEHPYVRTDVVKFGEFTLSKETPEKAISVELDKNKKIETGKRTYEVRDSAIISCNLLKSE